MNCIVLNALKIYDKLDNKPKNSAIQLWGGQNWQGINLGHLHVL